MTDESRGTLAPDEAHPAAEDALRFLNLIGIEDLISWRAVFATTAIEDNRLAEVCHETLDRLINQRPVSDRYLLGLAWSIMRISEEE